MTPADRIKRIIADHLKVDLGEVSDSSSFHDLGASDHDLVSIVMAVEDAFDTFELADDHIESAKTIGDLIRIVEHALGEEVG